MSVLAWAAVVVAGALALLVLACSMCSSQTDQAQERHDG